METLLSVSALLFILAAGFGTSLLLLGRDQRANAAEILLLSFLFGTGVTSLALFLLGFFFSNPWLRWLVTVLCMVLVLGGLARQKNLLAKPAGKITSTEMILGAAILVQVLVVGWLALHSPLGWDGLIIWEYKARLALINGGHVPVHYFQDLTEQWTHHEYPLYLPLTEAWLYSWLGRSDQGWAKLLFPLFYAAGTGLLMIGGARLSGRRWIGFAAAILLFFVPMVIGDVGAASGYCDFPLAVFYLGSLIYLIQYIETGDGSALRISAALAALMSWVKIEGVILWSIVVVLLTIEAIRRKHWKALPQVVIPGAVLIAGWNFFLAAVHTPPKVLYMPVTFGNLWKNIGRAKILTLWMASESINWHRWTFLWPVLIAAIFYLGKRTMTKSYLCLFAAVAAPLILYTATYIFTNWSPYLQHVESSLPRLMLAPGIVAVLIIATATPAIGWLDPGEQRG